MKNVVLSILGITMALPLFGFGLSGDGTMKTETRRLPFFTGIDMSGVGKLTVKRGSGHRVEITLDANLLPHYVTEVRNGVLHLGFEPGFGVSTITRLEVTVTVAELEGVSLSGASQARIEDGFAGKDLKLGLSGAGKLWGEIDYHSLYVRISGAGALELQGAVDRLRIEASGTGLFQGRELEAEEAEVDMSGTGRAVLQVTERLRVRVSGTATIEYYGNPQVEKMLSGVGRVERVGP